MPAAWAFFRHAVPDSESRLTISRTFTPELIIPSQMVPNFDLSLFAFWMSAVMPALLNAASSSGRSPDSQRGDVVASGRMTPTLPTFAAELEPPLGVDPLDDLLLEPPQPAIVSVIAAA